MERRRLILPVAGAVALLSAFYLLSGEDNRIPNGVSSRKLADSLESLGAGRDAAVREEILDGGNRVPVPAAEGTEDNSEPDFQIEGPESWAKEYESFTAEQLREERKRILAQVSAESAPYFDLAFQSGEYAVAPLVETKHGQGFSLPDDELDIIRIEVDNKLGLSKTATLPRYGYEGLYLLKEKALWMYDREQTLRKGPVGRVQSR